MFRVFLQRLLPLCLFLAFAPAQPPDIDLYGSLLWPIKAQGSGFIRLPDQQGGGFAAVEVQVAVSRPLLAEPSSSRWEEPKITGPFQIVSLAMKWPMNVGLGEEMDSWQEAVPADSAEPISFSGSYRVGNPRKEGTWKSGQFVCTVTPPDGLCWRNVAGHSALSVKFTLEDL